MPVVNDLELEMRLQFAPKDEITIDTIAAILARYIDEMRCKPAYWVVRRIDQAIVILHGTPAIEGTDPDALISASVYPAHTDWQRVLQEIGANLDFPLLP